METIDDEVTAAAMDFIEAPHKDGKPFFLLVQHDRRCISAPTAGEAQGQERALAVDYHDVMVDA